jgi:hypothetical protein
MTKPTNPVELLACAIATQEGWFLSASVSLAKLNDNPGDLDFAGQLNAVAGAGGFAKFSSPAAGVVGLYRQLLEQIAEGQTVTQIVAQWAPPKANNTSAYLQNVLSWTGLPANVPVMQLMPALVEL